MKGNTNLKQRLLVVLVGEIANSLRKIIEYKPEEKNMWNMVFSLNLPSTNRVSMDLMNTLSKLQGENS
jgi:hypothetical protein